MLASLCPKHGKRAPGTSDAERLTSYRVLETAWHPSDLLVNAANQRRCRAGGRDRAGSRDWIARSRVADKLLFLVEAVFLVVVDRADEVAERSYGFVDGWTDPLELDGDGSADRG